MECEKQVQDVLSGLIETVKSCKEFVIEQAPEVVRQMISLEIAQRTYLAIVSFVVFLIFLVILVIAARKMYQAGDDRLENEPWIPAAMFSGTFAAAALIPLLVNVYYLITVYAAPKVFVLNRLMEMAHK